jgi:hypothetical protein
VIHKHNPSKQQAIMQTLQPELMHLTQKHCSQSRSIIARNSHNVVLSRWPERNKLCSCF